MKATAAMIDEANRRMGRARSYRAGTIRLRSSRLIVGMLLLVSYTPARAGDLTGRARDDFIGTGMATCGKAQKNSAVNPVLGITDKQTRQYCECMMTTLADHVTFDELKHMNSSTQVPPSLQQKLYKAAIDCSAR